MIKTRKIGFLAALILVIAVATILLTPDPIDDVDALLRPQKIIKTFEQVSTASIAALPISRAAERFYLGSSVDSAPQAVFRMICAYRC